MAAASATSVAPARNALAVRLKDATDQQCFSISKALPPVSLRSVKKARALHRAGADPTMRLCSHFNLDPQTGEGCEPFQCGPVLWWFIAVGLGTRRALLGLTVTTAAKRIGVSHATASRAEAGRAVSFESFLLICRFVGLDPRDCVHCFDGPQKIEQKQDRSIGRHCEAGA